MPKAKPDSVIIHRIDMQTSVKESFDAYLAATAVTNAVGVAGSTLVALVSALAAPMGGILAALVAKEGIEEIAGKVTEKFEEAGAQLVEPLRSGVEYYRAIELAIRQHVGWLRSASPFLENVNGGKVPKDNFAESDMLWVYNSATDFWSSGAARRAEQEWIQDHVAAGGDAANPSPPPQGWYGNFFRQYFSPSRMIAYIKQQAKNPISRVTKGKVSPIEQKVLEGLEDFLLD